MVISPHLPRIRAIRVKQVQTHRQVREEFDHEEYDARVGGLRAAGGMRLHGSPGQDPRDGN